MYKSGIYQIINIENNHSYIGSAKNLSLRFWQHKNDLRKERHHSIYLQRAWNKYGEAAFEFKILEYCEIDHLIRREQYYLDELNPEYNICKIAGSCLGIIRRPESIEKHKRAMTGRKQTPEHIENARIARIGRKHTPEHIEKLRQANLGKPRSEETKQKISEAKKGCIGVNTGKVLSEEWRRNIGLARKGKPTKKKGTKQISTQGDKNGSAKLTEEQAIEILSLKQHLTLEACATEYNVTKACIKDLRLRRSWSHLSFEKQKSPRAKRSN